MIKLLLMTALLSTGLQAKEYVHIKDGKFYAKSNDLASIMAYHEPGDQLFEGTNWPGEITTPTVWAFHVAEERVFLGASRRLQRVQMIYTAQEARELLKAILSDPQRSLLPLSYEFHRDLKVHFPETTIVSVREDTKL